MNNHYDKDKKNVAKLDLFVKLINGDQRFPLKAIPVKMKVRQLKSEVELAAGKLIASKLSILSAILLIHNWSNNFNQLVVDVTLKLVIDMYTLNFII